jgi:putative SOS response-associated peptidase YedK
MCGRFVLSADAQRLVEEFGLGSLPPDYSPRWNIAPGQPILAVAGDPASPRAGWLLWGLVPWWQRDRPGRPLVNLRAETARRTAGRAFERHRCLIPADAFYEWLRRDGRKQPMILTPAARDEMLALAGVWERTERPDGEIVNTVAILTTDALGNARDVHDRMPLIIQPGDRATWLDRDSPADAVDALLQPRPVQLDVRPVSTRVNSAANDDPACAQPIDDSD